MLALMFVLCRLPLVQCGGGGVPNALPVVLIMEFMETFAKPGVGATHQPWVADLGGGSGALSMAAKMIGCNAMTIDSDAGLAKIVHESWQAVSVTEAWLRAIREVTPKNAPQLTLLADAPASEQERRVEGSTSSPAPVRHGIHGDLRKTGRGRHTSTVGSGPWWWVWGAFHGSEDDWLQCDDH